MSYSDVVYEPVSLGSACEAKFQLCRQLYAGFYGKTSEPGFRLQMMAPERGRRAYGWRLLDWQRTPFNALLDYFERDFEGVFERQDLYVQGEELFHRTLRTEHSHQFPGFALNWTDEDLDRVYPLVRRGFDERTVEFREHLTRTDPFLYVWTACYFTNTDYAPSAEQVDRLLELLGARVAGRNFHLLMLVNKDKDADYSGLDLRRVTKVYRKQEAEKPAYLGWEGNDRRWDEVLASYAFTLHDIPRPAAKAMQQAQETETSSLLRRLFGR